MRIRGALVSLAMVSLTLAGCGGDDGAVPENATPSVSLSAGPTASAAPENGAALDAAGFASAVKRGGTVLLDVRTPEEYAAGHLPGAVNIDVSAADFASRIEQLDRQATYGLYCRTGSRSAAAMAFMRDAGFTGVFHLADGFEAWTRAGGESEEG